MTITIELSASVAESLSLRAAQEGQNIEGYVEALAVRDAVIQHEQDSVARERNARLIALLDRFEQDGDAQEQARDYAALKSGLEAARPGQRRLFIAGFNL
jgi:hypothetical protein